MVSEPPTIKNLMRSGYFARAERRRRLQANTHIERGKPLETRAHTNPSVDIDRIYDLLAAYHRKFDAQLIQNSNLSHFVISGT